MYWPLIVLFATHLSKYLNILDKKGWIEYGARLSRIIYVWHTFIIHTTKWLTDIYSVTIPNNPAYMLVSYLAIFLFAVCIDLCMRQFSFICHTTHGVYNTSLFARRG